MFLRLECLVLCGTLIAGAAIAHAQCSVETIVAKGRVDSAPANARVLVRLVFNTGKAGESAEATVKDDGSFRFPVEFVTQSRGAILNGLGAKCNRRPQSVIVTLATDDSNDALDGLSLAFPRDFKMVDASAYAPRSEMVLNRAR